MVSYKKDNGKIVYSMDALFGLPRKKAAGQSHSYIFMIRQLLMNLLSVISHT